MEYDNERDPAVPEPSLVSALSDPFPYRLMSLLLSCWIVSFSSLEPSARYIYTVAAHPKGGSVPLNDEVRQRAGPSSTRSLTISVLPFSYCMGSARSPSYRFIFPSSPCWVVFFSNIPSTSHWIVFFSSSVSSFCTSKSKIFHNLYLGESKYWLADLTQRRFSLLIFICDNRQMMKVEWHLATEIGRYQSKYGVQAKEQNTILYWHGRGMWREPRALRLTYI